MATINLGRQDNGRTVTVAPHTTIVFSLPENPSTGYTWQLHPFTGPALVVTADSFTPSTSEPRPGASGTRTINVFAEAPGMETVVLQLQRPWEKTTPPVEKLAVTITVAADAGR